jgi:hypothetical protein
MSFTGTLDKCKACDKTVYVVDLLTLEGIPYHKNCFKCSHCKGYLTVCFNDTFVIVILVLFYALKCFIYAFFYHHFLIPNSWVFLALEPSLKIAYIEIIKNRCMQLITCIFYLKWYMVMTISLSDKSDSACKRF